MTSAVEPCATPLGARLNRLAAEGACTDCLAVDIGRGVSQAEFVVAFYSTARFKLERWILRLAVARPSTDAEARQLARSGPGCCADRALRRAAGHNRACPRACTSPP